MIEMLNCDCMDYMSGLPDKAFDLAIVDPPYGIGMDGQSESKSSKGRQYRPAYDKKGWDSAIPDEGYFSELFRVSKNQIIWGGNLFPLPTNRGWIFWNKMQNDLCMGDGELAWTSFDCVIRQFSLHRTHLWQEKPIHPTQKPVALYKWLLSRYAKPGDRILDTHGGSGSICIACHDLGFDLTWMEKDADYYAAAVARYKNHAAQGALFDPSELSASTEKDSQKPLFD